MHSWKENNLLNNVRESKKNDWSDKEIEYNDNGKVTSYKDREGWSYNKDYNDFGRISHRKSSDGEEVWYDYNEEGRLIHAKYEDGSEEWYDPKTERVIKYKKA